MTYISKFTMVYAVVAFCPKLKSENISGVATPHLGKQSWGSQVGCTRVKL